MRKFLILFLAFFLTVGFCSTLTLAQEDSWRVDTGVSVMNSYLTPRLDVGYGFAEMPLTGNLDEFTAGVKTPSLLFDLYGLASLTFKRSNGDLLAGWSLAYDNYLTFGIGKKVRFDQFLLRLEGVVWIDQSGDTQYGPELTFQYVFE